MNQFNPYYGQYFTPNIQQNIAPVQNVLPPQQILQCNGKDSVKAIKLSPNSSVLIADSSRPIIYKCISDSLGAVSIETFDVSVHKDEEQVEQENLQVMISDLRTRIERLENESYIRRSQSESVHTERIPTEADNAMVENNVQPEGND